MSIAMNALLLAGLTPGAAALGMWDAWWAFATVVAACSAVVLTAEPAARLAILIGRAR